MSIPEAKSLIPLVAASGYAVILLFIFIRRAQDEKITKWLLAFLVVSIAWEFLVYSASDISRLPNLPIKALLLSTGLLGVITSVYANRPHPSRWVFLGGGAVIISLLVDSAGIGRDLVLTGSGLPQIRLGSLVAHLVWLAMCGHILVRTWYDYRRTLFPWHANRLLFWLISLTLTFIGEALLSLQWTGLSSAGQITRLIGVSGLAFAAASYRIFDVRTRSQSVLAFFIITLISSSPFAAAVLLVQWLAREESIGTITFLIIITVSVGFLLYQPFRRLVERMVYRYLLGEGVSTGKVVRSYSRAVYRTLDVSQLSLVIIGTLGELMEAERGALILITETEGAFVFEPTPVMGTIPQRRIQISPNSPFISALVEFHQPLLQYEIDFNPDFVGLEAEVKSWLAEMAMEVYIPIGTGTEISGLIAIGPRSSGVPYQPSELETAQILADQTVVALQNSRLYSELAAQNEKIRRLNADLLNQNERLEIMDRVKSDFITIASHELRTPLTQVKGYADILSSMNDDGALTRDQTRGILGHINRASMLLESVITAMLDASQIDVAGIQLDLELTTVDMVVRAAMEPIVPATQERRISFNLNGLEDLPPIQADFRRLVQALNNLIGNAVKYTPDHGNIAILGTCPPTENGDQEFVELVIEDNGIGIDPKFHELIFEKFFRVGDPQLHSTGSTKFKGAGPGLGLPIARGVIEAHGGRVWVESDGEDEQRLPGSRFHVVLPLRPPGTVPRRERDMAASAATIAR